MPDPKLITLVARMVRVRVPVDVTEDDLILLGELVDNELDTVINGAVRRKIEDIDPRLTVTFEG